MSKTNEPTYITEARLELAKLQRNAESFAAQYRQYRAQNSDLAQPYKVMTKRALSHVRYLKRFIQKVVAIQKRLDDLTRRIAEVESRRGLISKFSQASRKRAR